MQWSDPKIISRSILLPTSNLIAHHSGLIVYNQPKQISLISSLESLNTLITISLKFKTWTALPKLRGLLTRGERCRGGELHVDGAVHCCRSSRRRERWRSSRRPDCDPEDTSSAKAGPWSIFRSCLCPVAVLQLVTGHPPCSAAAWPFYAFSLTLSWSKITKLGSFPKRDFGGWAKWNRENQRALPVKQWLYISKTQTWKEHGTIVLYFCSDLWRRRVSSQGNPAADKWTSSRRRRLGKTNIWFNSQNSRCALRIRKMVPKRNNFLVLLSDSRLRYLP